MGRDDVEERWATLAEALGAAEHRETLRAQGAGDERRVGP